MRGAAILRNGRLLTPHTHDGHAYGDLAVSIAIAWNQATTRRSGGRSRREARRAGSRKRVEDRRGNPAVSSWRCPNTARAKLLLTELPDGALGSPD